MMLGDRRPSLLTLLLLFVGFVHSVRSRATSVSVAPPPWKEFRPPSVPLLVNDPYLNVWSPADQLSSAWSAYWSGTVKALTGLIRVDGTCHRWMGIPGEISVSPLPQVGYPVVRPTITTYVFNGDGISMVVNFTTPALINQKGMDLMSRPVTFLDIAIESIDGKSHDVELYVDNTAEFAVNTVDENVVWEAVPVTTGERIMRIGTKDQNILGISGDNVGINWGYFYTTTDGTDDTMNSVMSSSDVARKSFVKDGKLPGQNDTRMPRRCDDAWPVLAFSWAFSVSASSSSSFQHRRVLFAYDDLFSIKWYGEEGEGLIPLWRKSFAKATDMIHDTFFNADKIISQCYAFDAELISNLTRVGGETYAALCSLAFRQAVAGTKLVWNKHLGKPWAFLKEISSDGDLSTVDVIFPASPLYLLYNTELVKLLLLPLFAYANNETSTLYPFTFAPHHLGRYPVGYIEAKRQENMPMEESGNMLMLTAAVGLAQGSFDFVIPKYSKLLKTWAEDIEAALPDPGKQLCTDDFEGPTAHNANLAVKGIVGLEAYAGILEATHDHKGAVHYRSLASAFAKDWIRLANNTDHYKLQYDLSNTWSQKYNLMFTRLLPNMTAFPESVFELESGYYLKHQLDQFGVPLDNRHAYTKIDWSLWIAAITNDENLSREIIERSLSFANKTPQRVPLSDWYDSTTGNRKGFMARPVVGGLFAKLLREQGMSKH